MHLIRSTGRPVALLEGVDFALIREDGGAVPYGVDRGALAELDRRKDALSVDQQMPIFLRWQDAVENVVRQKAAQPGCDLRYVPVTVANLRDAGLLP
jgi:hypothetical protein